MILKGNLRHHEDAATSKATGLKNLQPLPCGTVCATTSISHSEPDGGHVMIANLK
jgi:hypothetical protein